MHASREGKSPAFTASSTIRSIARISSRMEATVSPELFSYRPNAPAGRLRPPLQDSRKIYKPHGDPSLRPVLLLA
jgi:hypothetical protein